MAPCALSLKTQHLTSDPTRLYHSPNSRNSTSCRRKDLPRTNYEHSLPKKCLWQNQRIETPCGKCDHDTKPNGSHSKHPWQNRRVLAVPGKQCLWQVHAAQTSFQLRLQVRLQHVMNTLDRFEPVPPSRFAIRQSSENNTYCQGRSRFRQL